MSRVPFAPPGLGVPKTSQAGVPIVTGGQGSTVEVGEWPDYSLSATDKTWTIQGDLAVPSGSTDYINGWFAPVPPGQTLAIIGVWGVIRAGTSVTLKFQQNGSDISGLTGIVITTTPGLAAQPSTLIEIMNGDFIVPVITAVSGSPDNLSLGLFFNRQLDP